MSYLPSLPETEKTAIVELELRVEGVRYSVLPGDTLEETKLAVIRAERVRRFLSFFGREKVSGTVIDEGVVS